MKKFQLLYGYIDKQNNTIKKFIEELSVINLNKYENTYVFALKSQQLYTAIEDVFTGIAKTFENSIEDFGKYHIELLKQMTIEVKEHRPAVICDKTFTFLNKMRVFRHFVRHAYDYELDKDELLLLQKKIKEHSQSLFNDIKQFQRFLNELTKK